MSVVWLISLAIPAAVTLTTLIAMLRLSRAQRRHQRDVQAKLALLARVIESSQRKTSLLRAGLTAEQIQALTNLKRTQTPRRSGVQSTPPAKPNGPE